MIGAAAALGWPASAGAQQQSAKTPTIGFIGPSTPNADRTRRAALLERLGELGWVDDHNLKIEFLWADGVVARVVPLVVASAKPTVGVYPDWARAGLLMTYSADVLDDFRKAGSYAAKILGGARPGDLPVVQASKFVFAINLKTAQGLGIAVPPTLLTLADEVIE